MDTLAGQRLISRFLIVFALSAAFLIPRAQVDVTVSITSRNAPPPLVVYTQPPCPVDGYIWTPGYWAYDPDEGYFWVPGVWVSPPQPNYLWTPPYWGFDNGLYGWHPGYWGRQVGFYGGVNYGCGYSGSGYYGGMWQGGRFRYNTAVTRVNTTVIKNVYVNKTVINNTTVINNRTSYNGGPGGLANRPSTQEQAAMRGPRLNATPIQQSHQQNMRTDRNQLASNNHGQPQTVAMNKVNGNRYNAQGRSAAGAAPAINPARPGNAQNGRPAPTTPSANRTPGANNKPIQPASNQQTARPGNPVPAGQRQSNPPAVGSTVPAIIPNRPVQHQPRQQQPRQQQPQQPQPRQQPPQQQQPQQQQQQQPQQQPRKPQPQPQPRQLQPRQQQPGQPQPQPQQRQQQPHEAGHAAPEREARH